jgi:cell division protein FtsB
MTLTRQQKYQVAIAIQLAAVAIIGAMAGLSLQTTWIGTALLVGLLVFQNILSYTVIDNILDSKQTNAKVQNNIVALEKDNQALEESNKILQEATEELREYIWFHSLVDHRLYPPEIARKIQERVCRTMEQYYEQVGQPKLPLQYEE